MNFSKKVNFPIVDNKSDDENSYNGSNGTYDTDDDIQRRPTRVPNMKIQNRNALLARENRKRKKEMLDNLEKNVFDLQRENKKLQKMMKMKDSRTIKLEQEVRYLKSVIANRTEIVSVLKALPQFPTKALNNPDDGLAFLNSNGSETASCETFDENDIDVATEWDEILQNPFSSATDFSDITKLDDLGIMSPASTALSEISTEHNYFEKSSDTKEESGAGVCVHINSGRVSLEFCSTCHYNATNAWIQSN